jgi:TorA maturation chaperone TorD
MARLRPIKKLRQLTATALENWSAKRVQKFQQKAQHAEKAYMDGNGD